MRKKTRSQTLAENVEKLLIYILATHPQTKLDFEDMARYLTDKNQQCTARAVVERFKKLKRDYVDDPKWRVKAEQAIHGHGAVKKNDGVSKKRKASRTKGIAKKAAALEADDGTDSGAEAEH
ncbi:MAG: hypothetical protein Q9162_001290 [Coniocarpon cinnabarinum]